MGNCIFCHRISWAFRVYCWTVLQQWSGVVFCSLVITDMQNECICTVNVNIVYFYNRLMRRHGKQCLNYVRRGTIYFRIRSCIQWMYVSTTLILRGQSLHLHLTLPLPAFMSIQSFCWKLVILYASLTVDWSYCHRYQTAVGRQFLLHDAVQAWAMLSCSVRLSVTFVNFVKMSNYIFK